ncbi:MAG: AraC family transcriptional regulator [Bradyrhizobium sp.]|nr:AraC family transcriptional regulator [Bradyrhizobium sp.]
MKKLFSTADVHPRDRFDYWHSVACENIVGHDSRPECRQSFEAEIETGLLAEVGLVLFKNSPMDVSRTSRHIARSQGDELFVCRQVDGAVTIEQDGRQVTLEAGDITLLDPLSPYVANFSLGSKLLVLKFPRAAVETRVGKTRELVVRSMKPSEAEHSLTSSFLAMLPAHVGKMSRLAEEVVKDQALDLVAVSLAKAMVGLRPRVSSSQSLAMLSLRAAIRSRLSDPTLDAKTVATAAGISVRYANTLLVQENTSIMRLVQAMRLERCRRALEDRTQDQRSLSEIAYGWGFSDTTHFGRSFKAMYGILPKDFRSLSKRAR